MDEKTKLMFAQLQTELQKGLSEGITKDVMTKVTDLLDKTPLRKHLFGSDSADVELTQKKKDVADYVKAKFVGDHAKAKALSSGTSGEGKELAPEFFASEILRLGKLFGAVRRNANVVPVTTAKGHVPTAGSVTMTRSADGNEIAINPTTGLTGQVNYDTTKELVGLVPFSNQLLVDANVGVVDLLTMLFAEAKAGAEDTWGFLGLGVGEGIFQSTVVPSFVMPSGKVTYADFHPDHLLGTIQLIGKAKALTGAKFYMHPSVFYALLAKRGVSGEGQYLITPPTAGTPATLWGYPVEFSEVFPTIGDAGSQAGKKFATFGNLRWMQLFDRTGVEIDISKEASLKDGENTIHLFQKNMSALRVISRCDIQLAEAASAFVAIKTAAS